MIRVVLDTNVIVSSFLHPTGIPDRIIQAWKANLFELCLSEPLFHEIEAVLRRPVIQRSTHASDKEIEEFLELITETSFFVDEPLMVQPIIADDPSDDMILATALSAQADAIVSGDHHLQNLIAYNDIPIVNPRLFLVMIE
jgi:uncharacterized protein